jgi:hypothetical protein
VFCSSQDHLGTGTRDLDHPVPAGAENTDSFLVASDGPRNLEDALHDKNWKQAMDDEYRSLIKNKTWHLVPPQKGSNIIDCKWVYKI